jgi:hypothetical protein
MVAVRFAALAALVVWLGGMIVLGLLVAPAIFGALSAADPQGGRAVAGAVFGETLRRFHLLAYVCGAVIFVSLFVLKFVGPPPQAFVARAAIVAVMLMLAIYSGVPLTNQIEQVQSAAAQPVSRLPETDPQRLRFDSLHRLSTTLMTINVALGIVLLSWYVRE